MLDIIVCRSFFSKLRGLMFSKPRNLLFVFDKPRFVSLHMLFVFFPVTAYFLDKDQKVVDIICMKPFRIGYRSDVRVCYVLEVVDKDIVFRIGDSVESFI